MPRRRTTRKPLLALLAAMLLAPTALGDNDPRQPAAPGGWNQPGQAPGNTPPQAQPQDAAPDWVVPGVRITLYGETGTTLKENDPENPRIPVGGSGYQQFDVVAVTPEGVLMEVRYYQIPIGQTHPQLTDVQLKLFDAASGGQLWVPESERTNVPVTTAPDANPRIELGPYELEGDTYDAIHFLKTERNGEVTVRRVYDQRTGLLLYQSETLDDAEGKAIVWSRFDGYRVAQLPWQGSTLTDRVRALDRLVYESVVIKHAQPPLPEQRVGSDITFEIGQTTEHLMQVAVTARRHVPRGAPPTTDPDPTPVPQMISTHQRLGLYIAPEVLSQLESGQRLDEDPAIGYRIVVTDVYQVEGVTLVEITEQGPGNSYTANTTYDASVGLAVAGRKTIPALDITIESTLIRVE
ncbi:MAG: hypothetical protein AAGA29_02395 [Planctomycetota bacterium]